MPRKIIIDTDPGQDDAVALLLALASPEDLEVLAVVTVAGNVPLSHTTANARQVLELAGRLDLPLYAGCARPMRRCLVTAEHVHGATGLDGPVQPAPTMPVQSRHGVQYLIETFCQAEPGSITLVTLGPLTNVAMALAQAPDIAPRIREIVAVLRAHRNPCDRDRMPPRRLSHVRRPGLTARNADVRQVFRLEYPPSPARVRRRVLER
jgi:purine nucleosidase